MENEPSVGHEQVWFLVNVVTLFRFTLRRALREEVCEACLRLGGFFLPVFAKKSPIYKISRFNGQVTFLSNLQNRKV